MVKKEKYRWGEFALSTLHAGCKHYNEISMYNFNLC
jgi:hypothetical protein